MGHSANYVAIENGKATAYYDPWAGLMCVCAIDDGPSGCTGLMAVSEVVDELMDWAFAEAGFLVDFDEKRCIVFGTFEFDDDEDSLDWQDLATCRAFAEHFDKGPVALFDYVAPVWKGWTLEWDDRGVDAFADHFTRRGIATIRTQPPSAPENVDLRVEVRVDDEGDTVVVSSST